MMGEKIRVFYPRAVFITVFVEFLTRRTLFLIFNEYIVN